MSNTLILLLVSTFLASILCGYIASKKKKIISLAIIMGLLFGIFSLAYYLFCKTKSQEWKSKYLWYIGLGYIILTFLVACILYLPSVLNTNSFPAVPELDKSIHNYNVAMLKGDSKYCGDISNNTWRERCTAELTGNFAWCSNLIDGVNKDYEFYNDCLWTTALYKEDTMWI